MIILHVGYAKTGTTTLQKCFYPKISNVIYLGRSYFPLVVCRFVILISVFIPKRLFKFEAVSIFFLRFYFEYIPYLIHGDSKCFKKYARRAKIFLSFLKRDEKYLISHEVFLRPYKINRMVKRLNWLFSHHDLKVLVTTRNRVDMIFSRLNHDAKSLVGDISENIQEDYECSYPACRINNTNCNCVWPNNIRPISLKYFDFLYVKEIFERYYPVLLVDFFKLTARDKSTIDTFRVFLSLNPNDIDELLNNLPSKNTAKNSQSYDELKMRFYNKISEEVRKRYGSDQ